MTEVLRVRNGRFSWFNAAGRCIREICQRLESLGRDLVAQACPQTVYAARLLDLQVGVIGRRVPEPVVAISRCRNPKDWSASTS